MGIIASKQYLTKEDIDKLNDGEHVILFVKDRVYDATPMLNNHPGGNLSLKTHHMKDSTDAYDFHSKKAHAMWKTYFVGYYKRG